MNSKEKREEIVSLINNIKEHSDRLTHMPHMPLLEVSAILSKINRLHESTVVLKYLLAREQHHEDEEFGLRLPKFEEEEEEEHEEVEDDPLDASLEEDPHTFEDFDEDGADQEEDDLQIEEENLDLSSEFESSSSDTQTAVMPKTQTSIEELEQTSGMSSKADINEQYAEVQEDNSVSEQLKNQPITDLMAAIGLNERYLYANDLFEGDMEEFRKVVNLLNEYDNEMEAIDYFNSDLRVAYSWDDDNELANALLNLVKRRFSN